jgi:hypothetical protein
MNELRDKVIDTWKRQAQCGKDVGLSVDDTIINCADAVISAIMESTGWQDIAAAEIEQYEQNEPVFVLLPDGQRLIAQYEPSNGGGYVWFAQISNGNFCNEVYPVKFMPMPPANGDEK